MVTEPLQFDKGLAQQQKPCAKQGSTQGKDRTVIEITKA